MNWKERERKGQSLNWNYCLALRTSRKMSENNVSPHTVRDCTSIYKEGGKPYKTSVRFDKLRPDFQPMTSRARSKNLDLLNIVTIILICSILRALV
jgi:hypothetical protein